MLRNSPHTREWLPVIRALSLAVAFAMSSCSSRDSITPTRVTMRSPSLDTDSTMGTAVRRVPSASSDVVSLAGKRIYFGHQSVGAEIVAGMEALFATHPEMRLNLVETRDLAVVSGPAFVHFRVGRNEIPESKNEDLLRVLAARPRPDHGIVLLKYCFVDVNDPRDARGLFDSYQELVYELQTRFPDLTVVHATMPLTTVEPAWKAALKQQMGRTTARVLSRKRQEYNALLRAAYQSREPIFDIAEIESTRPDGSRTFFISSRDTIFTMNPEYTYDGGHLNEPGRRRAAEGLLRVLSGVAGSSVASNEHVR